MSRVKSISIAEAIEGSGPWQRVRICLKIHENLIRANIGAAAEVDSRNMLLRAIAEYAASVQPQRPNTP